MMKRGYGVFGKAYETMLRQGVHDVRAVDHAILKNMVRLDDDSFERLYQTPTPVSEAVTKHELYAFAQQFNRDTASDTVNAVLRFTRQLADDFDVPFASMVFGGTEKEIIARGTDLCTDMSRVGAALLQCLSIPSRIVVLVNGSKAYNGHQAVEAYLDNQYVFCDFLYGVMAKDSDTYRVADLLDNGDVVRSVYRDEVPSEKHLTYVVGLFDQAAISEYDITKPHIYITSGPNDYYLKLMKLTQDGTWQMGENR